MRNEEIAALNKDEPSIEYRQCDGPGCPGPSEPCGALCRKCLDFLDKVYVEKKTEAPYGLSLATYSIDINNHCVRPGCSRMADKSGALCMKCRVILDQAYGEEKTNKECETADCLNLLNYYDKNRYCEPCRLRCSYWDNPYQKRCKMMEGHAGDHTLIDGTEVKECESDNGFGHRCARTLGHSGGHTMYPGPVTPKFEQCGWTYPTNGGIPCPKPQGHSGAHQTWNLQHGTKPGQTFTVTKTKKTDGEEEVIIGFT